MMKKKALTLIEMLVSVTVFALLSISLYSLLHTGIIARKKIVSQQALFQEICLNLERLSQDLRNTLIFKRDDPVFPVLEGKSRFLSFIATSYDYAQDLPFLEKMTYEFDKGVLTRKTNLPLSLEPAVESVFLNGIKDLEFMYYDFSDSAKPWSDTWEKPGELPWAVRIKLTFQNGRKKEKVIEKYVVLAR